jgi:hypothetical protein
MNFAPAVLFFPPEEYYLWRNEATSPHVDAFGHPSASKPTIAKYSRTCQTIYYSFCHPASHPGIHSGKQNSMSTEGMFKDHIYLFSLECPVRYQRPA